MRESSDGSPGIDTEAVMEVLEAAPVALAVLYGSHARGEATAASDVDIAVAFEESLSSCERTRVRLALIERLSVRLDTDDVDVVPLAETPPELRRGICEDGVVIVGSSGDLEPYCDVPPRTRTREERLAEFDELLADLDRVV